MVGEAGRERLSRDRRATDDVAVVMVVMARQRHAQRAREAAEGCPQDDDLETQQPNAAGAQAHSAQRYLVTDRHALV